MRKSLIVSASLSLLLTACGQRTQTQNESDMDFVDQVKVALTNGGKVDLNSLQWTREPAGFEVRADTIVITTAPHTDLWQRTYYHFQNDTTTTSRTTMRLSCRCRRARSSSALSSRRISLRAIIASTNAVLSCILTARTG